MLAARKKFRNQALFGHYRAGMPKDRDEELLARYQRVIKEVKLAVDKADPIGLLALGAPEDEYDDVVGYLVSKVMQNDEITATSVAAWIRGRYEVEPSISTLVEEVASIQTRLHSDRRDT